MATNHELHERRMAAVPRGVASATKAFAARAENAEIWDVEGRRYIDFAAGIAVQNVGHGNPLVVEAVRAQLDDFTHTAFQVMAYESYVSLAERLNALAPFSGPAQTILLTTGAEAVENAVKIARRATARSGVIAFSGAFHGRTLLTLGLTGKIVSYKAGFGAMPPDIYHAPFPGAASGMTADESLRILGLVFKTDIDPQRVAAIIIEPVQGEGGFHVAPPHFLRGLRAICDRYGILLIADEIQSGIARTGRMFAIEHAGVQPDLVTVAKALGGGLPLAAVIGRTSVMSAVDPGGLGGTYAGAPLACAAAHAVLDIVQDQRLIERAGLIGQQLETRLTEIAARSPVAISTPRGLGAMIAFDVLAEPDEATGVLAKRVVECAAEEGLILLTCGSFGQTIRILVPLTISDAVLNEGLDKLEKALTRVGQERQLP